MLCVYRAYLEIVHLLQKLVPSLFYSFVLSLQILHFSLKVQVIIDQQWNLRRRRVAEMDYYRYKQRHEKV